MYKRANLKLSKELSAFLKSKKKSFTSIKKDGDKYVLGCGSNLLDKIFLVEALPKVGEKGFFKSPMKTLEKSIVGGVTLNHLAWAAFLQVPSGLLALQGTDSTGRMVRENLKRLGISDNFLKVGKRFKTAESYVFVQNDGERSIVMAPGSTSCIDEVSVQKFFCSAITNHACMLTTEISQVPLSGVIELLKIAKHNNVPTVLDFDISPSVAIGEAKLGSINQIREILSLCDIIKPAKHAAQELLSVMMPQLEKRKLSSKDIVRFFMDNSSAELVAMTNGRLPSTFGMLDCNIEVDAVKIDNIVDATGAGDAFLGGLIAGLYHYGFPQSEEELRFLGEMANVVGSANVMALGGIPVERSRNYLRTKLERKIPFAENTKAVFHDNNVVYKSVSADVTALKNLNDVLDTDEIMSAANEIINCKGIVFTTGIGKSGIIAERLASSLSSIHVSSSFVHAAEWTHGDLGKLKEQDIVICISHSGSTCEVLHPLSFIMKKTTNIMCIVGNSESKLASLSKNAICYVGDLVPEVLDVIPSRSLIVQEAIINVLVATIIHEKRFTRKHFLQNHPGGAIGDRFYEK